MNKLFSFSFLYLLFTELAFACPMCTASSGDKKELYIVYVLGVFIILCYIPMYILWRMVIKYRKNSLPSELSKTKLEGKV